jgi:hypothetical protein
VSFGLPGLHMLQSMSSLINTGPPTKLHWQCQKLGASMTCFGHFMCVGLIPTVAFALQQVQGQGD